MSELKWKRLVQLVENALRERDIDPNDERVSVEYIDIDRFDEPVVSITVSQDNVTVAIGR